MSTLGIIFLKKLHFPFLFLNQLTLLQILDFTTDFRLCTCDTVSIWEKVNLYQNDSLVA